MLKSNRRATKELARLCGHPLDKLQGDLKRDFYLTAAEAAMYGVVDQVMMPEHVSLVLLLANEVMSTCFLCLVDF